MKYTENAINVLVTRAFKGIGRAWFVKNWTPNLTVANIVDLINQTRRGEVLISLSDFESKRHTILTLLMSSRDSVDGVVAIGDENFPAYRGDVKNSEQPIFLFYKGDLSLLQPSNHNIAVIGLLTPTLDIELRERKVVAELVGRKITIVSGLALGCDSVAHREALAREGKTVAILPSPLSSILPVSNRQLAQDILSKGGLLVSEYLTEAKGRMALSSRYQERDRLQALFSDGIILSASYAKNNMGLDSGSRLAMGYAADYGIPRAVVYDDSEDGNQMLDLNRQYMREDLSLIVIREDSLSEKVDHLLQIKPRLTSQNFGVIRQKKMF